MRGNRPDLRCEHWKLNPGGRSDLVTFQVQYVKGAFLWGVMGGVICAQARASRLAQSSRSCSHVGVDLCGTHQDVTQNVCTGLLSHVVAYLFKTALSPNKSNSCSFRDVSIMTSVFCLHLHYQRGERETEGRRQRTAAAWCGFCVGAAALEALNSGASDETVSGWNKRRWMNVWFGLGCLWTDGVALQGGKFNKRRGEKIARMRGRERKRGRTHLHIIPGWFESLRNKGITLDGLNVLYPSHLLLQRNSLWNTHYTEERLWTKVCTHVQEHTDMHTTQLAIPCYSLRGTRLHLDWAELIVC